MGTENGGAAPASAAAGPLEARPGILLIGSPNVGKRSLLSRLLSIDILDAHDLSSGVLCQGWTIETKYYSADLSIWTAHLDERFSVDSLPNAEQLAALVMVFDMSDESSLLSLQKWASNADFNKFEILLCIGNKADLVSGHHAHAEYRRRMEKHGESTSDPHPEYSDFGINETEGCSLLWDEEPSIEIRKSSSEWCIDNNIEYIEACASNADFDKCLSVDGDIQGVERLFGALSAHMWPGMTLKSGKRITTPSLAEKEETTDDESDYEIEYEVLSHGSDELWYNAGDSDAVSVEQLLTETREDQTHEMCSNVASGSSTSLQNDLLETGIKEANEIDTGNGGNSQSGQIAKLTETPILDDDEIYGVDDMELLMSEISNMRGNLRLMPDFQRREMAAKLAMKMVAMFGDSSDEDGL